MDASGLSRLEKTGRQPLLRTATIRVGGRPERHRATLDLTAGAGRALLELSGQRSGTGVWQGRLEQLAISDSAGADGRLLAPVDVSWTPRQGAADLAVGELRWRGQFGELTVTELGRRAGVWRSRGQWRDLPVAGLLDALAAPKAAATAAGDLRLMAQWTARLDRQAEAVFSVQRQSGDGRLPALVGGSDRGGAIALGLKTLKFDGRLRDDQVALGLDLASEALGNANGRLEFAVANGDAGWQLAPGAPLRGELDLSVPDLGWLGRLSAGSLQLAGRVSAKASIAGTAAAPTVRGQISGDGLGVIWRDEGIQLRDGTLRADIDERALIIRALRLQGAPAKPPKALPLPVWVANGSGGDAVVAGEIAWRDQQGHLDFRAERFAVLQRPDLWLVASGSGRAVLGSNGRVDAKGTFRVDAAAIEIAATAPPRLGDDVKIRGAAPAEAGDGLPIDAIFDLDFGDAFQFSGRGLSGRIEGKLNLAQLGGAEPRAVGVVELKNGRFDAYGQLLEVERGIVNFQGPLDNPGLNVLALRPGLPVKAGVRVAGSVRQPRISLYSDPPLSEPEKLSWVVLGRGSDTASGADASTMLAAAQALLQSEGGGPLKQIAGALGIDEVSVGNRQSGGALVSGSQVAQSSGTTEASPAAQVIVVGKRLSSTTTLAYEQTLSGVGAVLKLTRQLTRSLSVTARTGAENALSLQWSKTFR
jgi:translocation and assembly module TamB